MKKYESPQAELIWLTAENILVLSSDPTDDPFEDEKYNPGGWL